MLKCWNADPALRPSFKTIKEHLDQNKRVVYVDLDFVNPDYEFPPCDDNELSGL